MKSSPIHSEQSSLPPICSFWVGVSSGKWRENLNPHGRETKERREEHQIKGGRAMRAKTANLYEEEKWVKIIKKSREEERKGERRETVAWLTIAGVAAIEERGQDPPWTFSQERNWRMRYRKKWGATGFAAGIGQLLLTFKERKYINEGEFKRERGRRPGRKRKTVGWLTVAERVSLWRQILWRPQKGQKWGQEWGQALL